jgi:hypothetical protein
VNTLVLPADFDIPDRSGWVGVRCPFHGPDRNPSASINPAISFFRCFSCGVAGWYGEQRTVAPREPERSRLAHRSTEERRRLVRRKYRRK